MPTRRVCLDHRHEDDEGTGDLPRPVRGGRGAVQLARRRSRNGPRCSATRASRSRAGTRGCSTSRRRRGRRPTATRWRASAARRASRSPSSRRISRASSSPCIPAYDAGFDGFAAPAVRGNPKARQRWAVEQVLAAAKASRNLGLEASVTFSGALAWPYLYPWPPRSPGLIEAAFDELAKRWKPIFDAYDEAGVDVGFELHPGEDIMDGTTFEMFLERVGEPSALRHQLRPVALRAAAARLPRLHRHLPRAHQRVPRQGRGVQPDRPPGRLLRLPGLGRARGPLPLAGRRAGRFQRDLLEARRSTTTTAGRCSSGSARSSTPSRAPPRARRSSRATSSSVTEHAFDDFAGGATDVKANRKALGI